MTMRVYQVDRRGTITRDTGKIIVPPLKTLSLPDSYLPCRCPLHRVEQAVSR
ncbi:hypothetical protein ABZX64_13725 [Streptomyces misionensis]|uniref:hypothetical protein n=1 Tax=Streptomyces misionensis TaxID=67331 RepID=UPI0033A56B4F